MPAVRPILFSAPMIRALLDGRKTQTRRRLPIPAHLDGSKGYVDRGFGYGEYLKAPCFAHLDFEEGEIVERVRPKWLVDDLLWVRETFAEGIKAPLYRADWTGVPGSSIEHGGEIKPLVWRPSLFMPRTYSRLTLAVTEVRVQRLQDISEADAIAEGTPRMAGEAREDYAALWNHLNDKPGRRWADNPWIVAVTFTVHKANVDTVLAKQEAA